MEIGYLLVSQPLDQFPPRPTHMKDSTQKFIDGLRKRYGPEEVVGRGNILNFGGQVTFAIRNSKAYEKGSFWFAIQPDFLDGRFAKYPNPPLGIRAALICDDERTVAIMPRELVSNWMQGAPSDRVHIDHKRSEWFFRISGRELIDVTEYINKFPGAQPPEFAVAEPLSETITSPEQQQAEIKEHTRIQWMLIKFGRAAGYTVWVPASDRGKEFNSERFMSLTIPELPNFGFDFVTNQTISNIDVLWFEGNVIHKAFEIESTTSIYSGLLRMSDLVLSQPNITIDLHIVAALRRRELVRKNILRPTFARLKSKCSYISFEEVNTKYELVKSILAKQKARIRDLLESEKFE